MTVTNLPSLSGGDLFDLFCAANSFEDILNYFNQLCAVADVNTTTHPASSIYKQLRTFLKPYWKASALFEKLDKRAERKEYQHQNACSDFNVSNELEWSTLIYSFPYG